MKNTIPIAPGTAPGDLPKEALAALAAQAVGARQAAHCPYSGIAVGAALLCSDGSVYTGANIENAAFSPSVCAERVAIFTAVHDGHRDPIAIAIAGGAKDKAPRGAFPPCGVCRQVMAEFFPADALILLADAEGYETRQFRDILPDGFGPAFLL